MQGTDPKHLPPIIFSTTVVHYINLRWDSNSDNVPGLSVNASALQDIRFPFGVSGLHHIFSVSFLHVVRVTIIQKGHCTITVITICLCLQCNINESIQKHNILIETKKHTGEDDMFSVSVGRSVLNFPCWFHPIDLQWH